MNDEVGLAPAVQSILDHADDRPGGEERVSVDARSLDAAFAAAEADGRVPIIAEVKPTSPTTEGERADDPVELAEAMVAGGAAALSVLTEPEHFGGAVENLRRVRDAVDVPVLRKDFLLRTEHLDVAESDIALLIARFLESERADSLETMFEAARERGFQALVEVHTRDELERAVSVGAEYIGVNNRDLAELTVDLGTFEDLAPHAPEGVTLIAESGVSSPADVRRMRDAGADALLVGSAIMADDDVEANTRELVSA